MTAYREPCASRGARTVREGASTRRLPHDTYNTSDTRGTSRSYGLNYQKLGKELKSVDELAVMPSSRCILQVQGVRPFYSRKYDLTRHPMYKYIADANPKYALDVKAYLAHRLKVKPEDQFEVYDLGEADSEEAA